MSQPGMTLTGPNYAAINAVNFGGAEECSAIPQSPYLGVEEMMVLLSTRLGALDGEVKEMMAQQQTRIEQRAAVSHFKNAMDGKKDISSDDWPTVKGNLEKAINELEPGDPVRAELEAELSKLDAKVGARTPEQQAEYEALQQDLADAEASGDSATAASRRQSLEYYDVNHGIGGIDESSWKAEIAEVDSLYQELGDNAEMEMLKLQSHMTKRTTLVQLTTNIVQKLEAAPDMIAKNI